MLLIISAMASPSQLHETPSDLNSTFTRFKSQGWASPQNFSQKDLIPGLEVRLLDHQAIGVAWWVHPGSKMDFFYFSLTQDVGKGRKFRQGGNHGVRFLCLLPICASHPFPS